MSFRQIIRRVGLFFTSFILLGVFQGIIMLFPFRIYAARLAGVVSYQLDNLCQNNVLSRRQASYAILVGRMVARVSRYTPWPSKCLVQALVTKFILRNFKISSTLVIGVGFESDGSFKAHAWVNVNYIFDAVLDSLDEANIRMFTIVGGASSIDEFKIIKSFSDHYVVK